MNNKYIIFTEYSMKTFVKSYYYLQYNENEDMLNKLNKVLNNNKHVNICGAYSEFIPMDMHYIIAENTLLNNFNKNRLDGYICNGKFILPNILDNEDNHNCDVLNDLFYNGNIKKYFIL